jgi:hypothetical protein
MAWNRTVAGVLAVLALGAGACGGGEDRPEQATSKCSTGASASVSASGVGEELAFPADEADTEIAVTLQNYAFVGIPATVKGPKVLFEAKVSGSNCHELEILDAGGDPVGEIPAFPSTETKTMAIELEPGTYTAQCLVKEGKKTHADLGMKTRFTVS